MTHTLTFYPLGNADCCQIVTDGGGWYLFDYADRRNPDDPADKRIDLPTTLRRELRAAGRSAYDLVAFSHADDDHVQGASTFFALDHASRYQGGARIAIKELWVPAAMILEQGLTDDARALRQEARHRLREGYGLRVFSRPAALEDWLRTQGLSVAARAHLIVDAGQLVPGYSKAVQGVEFFAHSPFASREEDGRLVDRNRRSIVVQATFDCDGQDARLLLTADTTWESLTALVRVTRWHHNEHRLAWDVVKVPHHCSYLSLNDVKGAEMTTPTPEIAWLYGTQGQPGGKLVSSSDPIPAGDTTHPPHRQAAAYYQRRGIPRRGEFIVTMAHPTVRAPEPLVILLDARGARVRRAPAAGSARVTTVSAPRAG